MTRMTWWIIRVVNIPEQVPQIYPNLTNVGKTC